MEARDIPVGANTTLAIAMSGRFVFVIHDTIVDISGSSLSWVHFSPSVGVVVPFDRDML